jgi:uncharacterized protein YfaS (alpha-2-macroglobulin family)
LPQVAAALRFAARNILAGLLAAAAAAAGAAEPAVRVLTFSPQGAVPGAQQVRATFSEPMQPLGRLSAPAPFTMDCKLEGQARWVDDRTWVMDLDDQAVNGQACTFRVKPALRSLAGHAVGEPLSFQFQLPLLTEDTKRTVQRLYPWPDSDWITEDQVFLLGYSHPLGSARPDLRCETPGQPEAPVLRLPPEVRDGLTKDWFLGVRDDSSEAVRCPFTLAPGSPLTLRLLRPGLKPYVAKFKVRGQPAATLSCRQLPQKEGCAAGFPVSLTFNAAMPQALLRQIRLEGAPELRASDVRVQVDSVFHRASSTVTFAAALEPDAEYHIHWPDGALADVSGRTLPRDGLPRRVKTLPALDLAYIAAPPFSIRPLSADNRVDVVGQGLKASPVVREQVLRVVRDGESTEQDLLRRLGLAGNGQGDIGHFWRFGRPYARLAPSQPSLLGDEARTLPLRDVKPAAPGALHRSQVVLQGAGLHVVELQAFAGAGRMGPIHDSVAVLLTRLAVHLKLANENGAVWVTQWADGTPVADVALSAYDCRGHLAWQGRTDARGLAAIDRQGLARCDSHPDNGVTVVARHTWPDGERDLSLANSRWTSLLDAGSYAVNVHWLGSSPTVTHTVFDRSLFKPGETVAMRHVVRHEGNFGLLPPAAHALPQHAKVRHLGSGKEWTVPLAWPAPGEGSSRFALPADAPLGRYEVLLDVKESRLDGHHGAGFAVEAFRLPAMSGSVQATQTRLVFGMAPALQLALHYADGGAAQHWPVTLKVYAQARGYRRPALLDAYPSSTAFAQVNDKDDEPAQLLLHEQALTLDGQGRAQLALPALPARAQPYRLHAELSYADPNGEAQTLSQDFDVQPSLLTVGVRTVGSLAVGRRVQVQSLVVDEHGARRGAQPVRVQARQWNFGADKIQDLGDVCSARTDANGQLVCSFVPPQPGIYQFEAQATDAQGRPATTFSSHRYLSAAPLPAEPLFLHADKTLYREGETASLTVSSPFPRSSRAWLTVERQGILESRVLMLAAGQSRIRLPIRRAWAGNVAVSLLALDAGAAPRATAVATGITELVVSTEARALRVTLKPARPRYQPGEQAQVRVHVAAPPGQRLPAVRRLTFVAVDEALLSLRDNASWQLLARMLQPRRHQVRTASGVTMNPAVDDADMRRAAEHDLLIRLQRAASAAAGVVPAPAPALQSSQAIKPDLQPVDSVAVSGSRIARPDDRPPVRTLLDSLLFWQADVPVDNQGNAVVSFPIKDSLSRFRLVALASAGDEFFGTGMAHLDVMTDLQITAGLPPQVREGDRFTALVTVRNTSARAITLEATARPAGQAGLPPKTLQLRAGESRQLGWEVSVPTGIQTLSWTFTAHERDGARRQDALQATQQVEPAVPVTVQAATLAQVQGSFDIARFGFDHPDASAARVSVQLLPSLAGQLGGVQAWLSDYAYRCLEQNASRAVGRHDRAAWNAVMAELPRHLDDDGLADYFPASPARPRQGSDTLTGYLLDLAHAAGWPIPEAQRDRMLNGLDAFVAGRLQRPFWAPRDDRLARRIAAMATLARHGRLKPGALDTLRVDADEWTTAMLTDWLTLARQSGAPAATLAQAEQALRTRLVYQGRRMSFSTEASDYWWWLMSNGDVDAARLLLAVADLPGWQADLPRLLTGLLARQQKHGAWATTNANAWGTLAVDAFAKLMEPVPVAGVTHIALGSHRQTVDWRSPSPALNRALNPATDALQIRHDGAGAPWAAVEVRAAVPLKAPRFAGYGVSRSITPVQQKVAGQWQVGDIARVRLNIRAQTDMSWVVVDDPVPAGASILGTGLGRDSTAATAGEQAEGRAWPLYQARDFTSLKSYYRHVPRGDFSLEYTIRLNNPGKFSLPPTRVEAMYAPEVFGEAPNATFRIMP